MPGAPPPRPARRGFLRGNRALIILLIDVVIIAILVLVYRQFLVRPADRADLAGYQVSLRAMLVSDGVFARVEIAGGPSAAGGGQVFVHLQAAQSEARLAGELPTAGTESSLETILPFAGAEPKEVKAEVRIGDGRVTLERRLNRD
jgi:hypothetical protein